MKNQIKLFNKVKCKSYYAKANDGVHMQMYDKWGNFCDKIYNAEKVIAYQGYDKEEADLSEFCGQSVKKVYRKVVKK